MTDRLRREHRGLFDLQPNVRQLVIDRTNEGWCIWTQPNKQYNGGGYVELHDNGDVYRCYAYEEGFVEKHLVRKGK